MPQTTRPRTSPETLGFDMSMEQLYDQALNNMENTVHALAQRVSPPQRVPYKDSFVFRYVEKSIHQALVQKLARLVSTLHAARLLMEHGFVQEQATLQRVLDEMHEDITFLAFAVIFSDMTLLLFPGTPYLIQNESKSAAFSFHSPGSNSGDSFTEFTRNTIKRIALLKKLT